MNKIKSLLFVPAREKFFNKISQLNADLIIFDLEESILEKDKDSALQLLLQKIESIPKKTLWYVRLNKNNIKKEAGLLTTKLIDGFMLPKFNSEEDLSPIESYIEHKQIIALIETPIGVINIDKIVKLPKISAIAFGAEDYTALANIKNVHENLIYPKSRLVTYCKAYNKPVFDTPCLNTNRDISRTEINQSLDMGFDGKLAINPTQADLINEIFQEHDYDYIKYVVEEFERNNSAVLSLGGKVYEKMHYQRFKEILNNLK